MFAKIRARRQSASATSQVAAPDARSTKSKAPSTESRGASQSRRPSDVESRFSFSPDHVPVPNLPLSLASTFRRRSRSNSPTRRPSIPAVAQSGYESPLRMTFDFELPSEAGSDFALSTERALSRDGGEGAFGDPFKTKTDSKRTQSPLVGDIKNSAEGKRIGESFLLSQMRSASLDSGRIQETKGSQADKLNEGGLDSETRNFTWSQPTSKGYEIVPLVPQPPVAGAVNANPSHFGAGKSSLEGRPSESESMNSATGKVNMANGLSVGELDLMNIGSGNGTKRQNTNARSRPSTSEGKKPTKSKVNAVPANGTHPAMRETAVTENEKDNNVIGVQHSPPAPIPYAPSEHDQGLDFGLAKPAGEMVASNIAVSPSKATDKASTDSVLDPRSQNTSPTDGPQNFISSEAGGMEATMFPTKSTEKQQSAVLDATPAMDRDFVDQRDRSYSQPRPKSIQSPPRVSQQVPEYPLRTPPRPPVNSIADDNQSDAPREPSPTKTFASWAPNSTLSPESTGSQRTASPKSISGNSSISGSNLRPKVATNLERRERPPSITGAMLSPRFSPSNSSSKGPESLSDRPVSGVSLHPSVLRQQAAETSPSVAGSRLSWTSSPSAYSQNNRLSGQAENFTSWKSASPPIPELPTATNKNAQPSPSSSLTGSPVAKSSSGLRTSQTIPVSALTAGNPVSVTSPLRQETSESAASPVFENPPVPSPDFVSKDPSPSELDPNAAGKTLSITPSGQSSKSNLSKSLSPVSSPTIGMPYSETSQQFPLPQHVSTRPKTDGAMGSVAGVNVPTHHTTGRPEPNKSDKRRTRLLNPMALLSRRKTGSEPAQITKPRPEERLAQAQALAKQRAVAAKGVDTLPEDFDPRIKGKVVHDFSAPKRATRNFSYNDTSKEVISSDGQLGPLPTLVASSPLMPNSENIDSLPPAPARQSVHSPVFREHFGDETDAETRNGSLQAERLENKEFLKRASQHSAGNGFPQDVALASSPGGVLPPFARRSQAWNLDPMQAAFASGNATHEGSESRTTNQGDTNLSIVTATQNDRNSRASGFVSPVRHSMAPSAAMRNSFSPVSPTSMSFSDTGRQTKTSHDTKAGSEGGSLHTLPRESSESEKVHRRGNSAQAPEFAGPANSPADQTQHDLSVPDNTIGTSSSAQHDPSSATDLGNSTHNASDAEDPELLPPQPWAIRIPSRTESVETPEHTPDLEVGTHAIPGRAPPSPPRLVEKRASAAGHGARSPGASGMKHHVSNASRFSFQFGGSAVEEEALEEKGRKMASTATGMGPGDYEDEEDYFDEDAMNDPDEMEMEFGDHDGEHDDYVSDTLQTPQREGGPGLLDMRRRLVVSDSTIGSRAGFDDDDSLHWSSPPPAAYGMHANPTFHSLSALANATPDLNNLNSSISVYSDGRSLGNAVEGSSEYSRPIGQMHFTSDDSDATVGNTTHFDSSPPVATNRQPQRPPLPHRDSGNSERNRQASGLTFGHSAMNNGMSSPDDNISFLKTEKIRPPIPSLLVPDQPPVKAPRNTMMAPPSVGSGFDDMYFDDGGFEQDIVRPRSRGQRMDEEEFDNPAFLARPSASRNNSHQRDNSSLTSSSIGDGPYPSFAMGTNASKVLQRQSQFLLEDIALQHNGPVDPKLIPQRNPSEDAKRLGLSDKVPPLPPPPGSKEVHLARVQNNLFAYHAALAEAANQAEADGRFMWRSNSVSTTGRSSMYSYGDHSPGDDQSDYSREEHEEDDLPTTAYYASLERGLGVDRPDSKASTGSRAGNNVNYSPGKMGFDFGFNDQHPDQELDDHDFMNDSSHLDDYDQSGIGDDDDYDDIIAAANADALSSDIDGFYGQEFGFYAKAKPHAVDTGIEAINGGFFGADGDDGLSREKSSREPNLTPITERSEFSTRNSFIGGPYSSGFGGGAGSFPPSSVPGSAGLPLSSPMSLAHFPTSPLMEKDVTSFEQLRKLRASAFAGAATGNLPAIDPASGKGIVGPHPGYPGHRRRSSAGSSGLSASTLAQNSVAPPRATSTASNYVNVPGSMGPPPRPSSAANGFLTGVDEQREYSSAPPSAHPGFGFSFPAAPDPSLTGDGKGHRSSVSPGPPSSSTSSMSPPALPSSNSFFAPPPAAHGHSRKGSDSVTYVREQGGAEQHSPRWVLERRRTSEIDGESELVERQVVTDGWI